MDCSRITTFFRFPVLEFLSQAIDVSHTELDRIVQVFYGLVIEDALEAILNAEGIDKTLNSTHPKTGRAEKLYIIKSCTYDGILIYTKGKIEEKHGQVRFYILISSKRLL